MVADDTDNTDDIDDTDDIMRMVDPVAAAIALSDLADKLYKLYSLATNSNANKARLRALAKLNRQIADAEAKRAAIEIDAAAGSKEWRTYNPRIKTPLPGQSF